MKRESAHCEQVSARHSMWLTRSCALLAMLMGALVLGSYWFSLELPELLFPKAPRMKPNTAGSLVLLGVALLDFSRPRQRQQPALSASCSGLVLLLALLSLLKLGVVIDIGHETLLVRSSTAVHMSPIAASGLAFASAAIFLSALGSQTPRLYQSLVAMTALSALVPFLGYLYEAPLLYQLNTVTSIALPTTGALLLLTVALITARCDEGLWPLLMGEDAGALLTRRALPLVVCVPLLLGWIRHYVLADVPEALGTAFTIALTVVMFTLLLLWSAGRLRNQDLARQAMSERLLEAHDTLEARVTERTHELMQSESKVRLAATRWMEAKEAAETAMRARTDFLARMSHEMRTPLNGVVGMLDIALRTELTPAQRDYVHTARSSADALLSLINDILDFAKMDAGKLSLESAPFRLRDCLATALRESAHAAHKKGLELYLRIPEDVPDCFSGDPQRLRQVVSNLVSNAVKFTERGEVRLEVRVVERRDDTAQLELAVVDTGIGIPADKQDQVFHAFAQADESTTRRFGGTGLGLSISGQLVELMGGQLRVDSREGQGSKFYFSLELSLDPAAEQERTVPDPTLAGSRVLLIEPHEPQRALIHDWLTSWGVRCVSAGAHHLPALLNQIPDHHGLRAVLVSDDALSSDGIDAAVLAERRDTKTPIVLLTHATPADSAREQLRNETAAQLTKPLVPADLRETLLGLFAAPTMVSLRPPPEPSESMPIRVLLAEDNEVNRRVARFVLEDEGFEVITAGNGREALAVLNEQPVDAVLMDGHMPIMDGLEATRQLRLREEASGAHLPVVALTAQAMKGDEERYLAAGMDAYLTKPINREQLIATLHQVVGRKPSSARQERLSEPEIMPAPARATGRSPDNDVAPLISTPPAPIVYDRDEVLRRMRGQLNMLRIVVQVFQEELPDMVGKLKNAVESNDAAQVDKAAHKLAGSLVTVGGLEAARVARKLELLARHGQLLPAPQLMSRLSSELGALQGALLEAGDATPDARTAL